MKSFGTLPNGHHILAATAYYTATQILSELQEVAGVKARYAQITADQYKSYLPGPVAQEFLENHLLIEDPGYYAGAVLEPSLELLDEKPTTWKEYLERTKLFQ